MFRSEVHTKDASMNGYLLIDIRVTVMYSKANHSSKTRFTVEDDPLNHLPHGRSVVPLNKEMARVINSSLDEFAGGRPRKDSRTNDTRTTAKKATAGKWI